MYKHILIPTDGSPLAREAIPRGIALAKLLGAKVNGLFSGCFRSLLKYTDSHHTPRVKRQTVCTFTSFTRRSTSSLRHSSVPGIINVADPAATAYRNANSID